MERILLERVKQGDIRAFESVYHEFYEILCRFALQLLHSPTMAEEVADDVLFYLWDHREDLQIRSLQSYLLRAVRNQSLNRLASSTHRQSQATTNLVSAERVEYLESLFDNEHPLEQLLYKEMEERVKETLNSLSSECRNVFVKCRIEGKKYAEAAAELGISVNTVKYHLRNATVILSESIKGILLLYLFVR